MRYLLSFLLSILFLFSLPAFHAFAVVDPIAVPNNKVGIHILFPEEVTDAAKLINGNGGAWGYVIIPIQTGDRNLQKWQKFMNDAKRLKVIPIIRIASEGDYFNTHVWRKPTDTDVLDFANFLNSLSWPTKNRYVVIFNEVNRADEWGGEVNPSEYADLLSYAVTVFKSKSQDFFIISAGLDNASANTSESMNEFDYMRAMNAAVPNIFLQIDGLGSHSYPNPGFSQPPSKQDQMSIASYKYQENLLEKLGGKKLPVFITETGWSTDVISPSVASSYLQTAFTTVWADPQVIAVTPFLFKSGPPFSQFSFMNIDGSPSPSYTMLSSMLKMKGSPILSESILGDRIPPVQIIAKNFSADEVNTEFTIPPGAKTALKWFLKIPLQ
jgi:hypothetical protein